MAVPKCNMLYGLNIVQMYYMHCADRFFFTC